MIQLVLTHDVKVPKMRKALIAAVVIIFLINEGKQNRERVRRSQTALMGASYRVRTKRYRERRFMDCVDPWPKRYSLGRWQLSGHHHLPTCISKNESNYQVLARVQACTCLRGRIDMSPFDWVIILALQNRHVWHFTENTITNSSRSEPVLSCQSRPVSPTERISRCILITNSKASWTLQQAKLEIFSPTLHPHQHSGLRVIVLFLRSSNRHNGSIVGNE